MKKQSVKRRRGDGGSAITMDRLSQLPQPILHHILSLLSQKDAVRTCVLSKPWRYLWHGRLNVEVSEQCFARNTEFLSFLDETLQRYHDQNLSLQQVLVDMHSEVDSKSTALLQKWIPMVTRNTSVRSLSLIFSGHNIYNIFAMPLVIFQAEFLVELHLQRCNLNPFKSTDNVMSKNLQTLRLHNVHITDESLEKIMSSCPLIENVDLVWCRGLKSIKLHKHHKIKDFCSASCGGLNDQSIEIEDAHTLESIRIKNYRNWFLHHNSMCFPQLKSLNLYKVQLTAETFDNFSSNFPCLNELMLDSCYGFKEFFLSSCSIRRLTIKMDTRNRIKALINTPNILYFEYPSYGFLTSIKFATTFNEWKSHISVWYKMRPSDTDATSWFLKLNKLLNSLSQSHISLNLIRKQFKNLYINDSYVGFFKPVVVEKLRLWGYFSSSSVPAILNCFFRVCRPRYIHMDQYANGQSKWTKENNRLAELICKLNPKETGETRQCYFWLQDLEEVSIEVWDMKAEKWNCVQGTSLPALPKKQLEQQIRFRLKWREQLSKFT